MADCDLRPFQLSVPEPVLKDLRQRLPNTRFPDEPPLASWSTGTSVAFMKKLIDCWRDGFDWRAQEAKLNAFRQFTVPLAGIDVHFIHGQGKGPDPMPLWLYRVEEIAEALAALMTDVLGFERFGAQGGDWGVFVATRLGFAFHERMVGIHLNFLAVRRDPRMVADPTPEKKVFQDETLFDIMLYWVTGAIGSSFWPY